MNYLLKAGTMTSAKGLVFVPGDVLTAEDLTVNGVGVERAMDDLKVVEETERERFVSAEIHPEVAIALASNTPVYLDDDGTQPGAPSMKLRRGLGKGKGKAVLVARNGEAISE